VPLHLVDASRPDPITGRHRDDRVDDLRWRIAVALL
jgi:hypothetical protein